MSKPDWEELKKLIFQHPINIIAEMGSKVSGEFLQHLIVSFLRLGNAVKVLAAVPAVI